MRRVAGLPAVLIGLIVLIAGCAGSGEEGAAVIDYAGLDSLEVTLEAEFTESDAYLPGRIINLEPTSDEMVVVADWGTNTLEQFNPSLEHIATVAERGQGPGELQRNFFIQGVWDDTLLVANFSSNRFDYFTRGEDDLFRYQMSVSPEKSIIGYYSVLDVLNGSRLMAYKRNTAGPAESVKSSDHFYESALVELNGRSEMSVDSVNFFRITARIVEQIENGFRYYSPPTYVVSDDLDAMPGGGYVIARPDSSTLYIYGDDHELKRKITLEVRDRPVRESDIEYVLKDRSEESHDILRTRIPAVKPPFMEVYVGQNYLWLYTDIMPEAKEFVVLDRNGKPLGRFYLQPEDNVQAVRGNKIYSIYRNPEAGDQIRIYEVSLSTL